MTQSNEPAPPSADEMALNDDDISFLCDIGDSFSAALTAEKSRRLARLLAAGFVENTAPDGQPGRYRLTAKAEKFLAERGAGLGEA